MSELLQTFAQYIRANAVVGREAIRIGAFTLTFTAANDSPYLNYAIPDEDAEPKRADVDLLIEAYRTRQRIPRLEYFPELAEAVEPMLTEAGFVVEAELPLMVCTTETLAPAPVAEGVTVRAPETDEEYLAVARAQYAAYGEAEEPGELQATGLRHLVDQEGIVALGLVDGVPAGGGVCDTIHNGYGEIAGIGTVAEFRRRGVATAITHWLTARALAQGAETAFLTPATDYEERIYAGLGYRAFARQVHTSLPVPATPAATTAAE